MSESPAIAYSVGIVKQVLSGDTIVIRDRPIDGPPPEKTIVLSQISCGKLARKPTVGNPEGNAEDEFAWEAREFVRSKAIGKEVYYSVEKELSSGRSYGTVFLGTHPNGENLAISLLQQGLAELRKMTNAAAAEKNTVYQQYLSAEDDAKSSARGRWSGIAYNPRSIVWTVNDPKDFLERVKGSRLHAVVEYVRDGNTLQLTVLPVSSDIKLDAFYVIWLSISGIRTPSARTDDSRNQAPEPFGLDAQFFVESRLLQREVTVIVESIQNQTFLGSVLHPNGNIAEVLLREGLAKCIDWSLSILSVPGAAESYKSAERVAKAKRLRLWQNVQTLNTQSEATHTQTNKVAPGMTFTGQILEVGNGDNVTVKCSDGVIRKVFLSSVRGPKPSQPLKTEDGGPAGRIRTRPLFDVPYAFEAREHLRSFVGQPVSILVDYIQPKTATIPDERICCTVKCGSTNLAESVVSAGLATVIIHRNSDDARSSAYLELKASEEKAIAQALGMHSKSDPPSHRISDLTSNVAKARQFLPFFKRSPKLDAIVEFVVHASRMRVYLPHDSCIVTLLVSGVQCPRKGGIKPDGSEELDAPFSMEAYTFVRELCTQRNLEVTIENMDRVGNFIGWVFLDAPSSTDQGTQQAGKKKKKAVVQSVTKPKINLSVLLVSKGLATVHRTSAVEASPYYQELIKAEECAKKDKLGLWSSDEFVQRWETILNETNQAVSDVGDDLARQYRMPSSYVDDLSMMNLNGPKVDDSNMEDADKAQWIPAQVTAIPKPVPGTEGLRFFVQYVSDSSTIVQITHSLNSPGPSLLPNYQPKKGEIFAACFSVDHCWYRARVMKQDSNSITVQFIDFGNEETIPVPDQSVRVAPLTGSSLTSIPPQARECRLAFIQLPPDASDRAFAERAFATAVINREISLAVRFNSVPCATETIKPVPAVSIKVPPGQIAGSSSANGWLDVGYYLIEEGLVCIEPMRPSILKQVPRSLLSNYVEAQAKAKQERKNVWRFGDFRVDADA